MLFLQKLKFPIPRTLMDISQKKMLRKNYFPRINSFPSAMSHMHKSTKMRFPGNRPKMVQLHKNITSSKMVVRGWYMSNFDHRDLLNSKKIGLGWFPQLVRPLRADLRFFSTFSRISIWAAYPRKQIFQPLE